MTGNSADPLAAARRSDRPVMLLNAAYLPSSHGSRALPLWDLLRTAGRSLGEPAVEAVALGEHAHFVGTPEDVADQLRRRFDEDGVDGFQIILGSDFPALCDTVLPRLLSPPG